METSTTVLDDSKIEDDDVVDIVFTLTSDYVDHSKTTTSVPTAAPARPVLAPQPDVGQKRQHSLDDTPKPTVQRSVQISSTFTHTEISSTKTFQNAENQRPRKKKSIKETSERRKQRSRSDLGLFKMFNKGQGISDARTPADGAERTEAGEGGVEGRAETVNPRKCFVHYDSQSILVDYDSSSLVGSVGVNNFKNLKSGAATTSLEDCVETHPEDLLQVTPKFINEVYEEGKSAPACPKHQVIVFEGITDQVNGHSTTSRDKLLAISSNGDFTTIRRFLSFEHMDHGCNYYRRYFADHDHVNYFGVSEPLGPIAISVRREKIEMGGNFEPTYQFRIIIRSAKLPTLRGSILEDFLPSARGVGNGKVSYRDVLECIAPGVKQDNLKLGEAKKDVVESLLKFDDISLNVTYKVGLVYCKAGQKTEEEMYNNAEGSPAFEEFMDAIGDKVALKGFDSFRGGLDNKNDTTGAHSLYTRFNNCQIMFHVSTLLPFAENDKQQVVRKRHIGNDIVTVIFQEPGSVPFTPAHFRSHYQHVFFVVRVNEPCTPNTTYEIAITRSDEVPEFGPPISERTMKKDSTFRHFLLTKIINSQNASVKACKLSLMATRTREQYLTDFCNNMSTTTSLLPAQKKGSSTGKLTRSWSFKKKGRIAQRLAPEMVSKGALMWRVSILHEGLEKPCILAVSQQEIVLVETKTQFMVCLIECRKVLGWTSTVDQLKLYYGAGEAIQMRRDTSSAVAEDSLYDMDDIVKRLTCVSNGCETQEIRVIKDQQGKLGFHIQYEGIVGTVAENGPAWAAGLRHASRLLEVRDELVAEMQHEQLIKLLKGKDSIVVVALPPYPDGEARRNKDSPTPNVRAKAVSISSTVVPAPPTSLTPEDEGSEEMTDTITPLTGPTTDSSQVGSRPASRERIISRGSMIALNMLEQELGIEDAECPDIEVLLEELVGKDKIDELNNDIRDLEARSTCSSRPQTPSQHTSQQSVVSGGAGAEEEDEEDGISRHLSYTVTPSTATRQQLTRTTSDTVGRRFALNSDNTGMTPMKDSGGRYNNGHRTWASRGNNESTSRPDINEIFKMIDKTRNESESNSRSPTDDISEIDEVVNMINRVLENTDAYLSTEDRATPRDQLASFSTETTETEGRSGAAAGGATPRTPYGKPSNAKVEIIQRKMADYNDDMTRAIEQLDSIKLDGSSPPPPAAAPPPTTVQPRRTSLSSSSLSEEESAPGGHTSDSVNVNSGSSTSDEEVTRSRHYTMRKMRREGLLMEPASDTSDQSRASDDIPPSPLQMLMERAREARLDQTLESDNSWVRTTLLRIAELEAALERSNSELQILRKQNREMEQTLEVVDEENAKIRREMDRTNSQLATFTAWVQNRQLL